MPVLKQPQFQWEQSPNAKGRLGGNSQPLVFKAWLAAVFVVIHLFSNHLSACSVPVFRYALERWEPDAYGVVVFHEGPLSPEQQGWVDQMDPAKSTEHPSLNCMIRTVDLSGSPEQEAVKAWEEQGTSTLPWVVVYYPWRSQVFGSFWSGPLNKDNVSKLIDSPGRREVARRLLKGESAVWVLLESGDTAKDEKALRDLETRFTHLESTLKLPVINPVDISEGLLTIDEDQLRVDFSAVKISRNDPQESFFVKMLLGSEEHLSETQEPIAFPIFGRGRLLYSLVGESIANEVIDDACTFLTGECSCQVKDQNPGVDLIMSVDWDRMVKNQLDIDRELPPLTGMVGMLPSEAGSQSDSANSEQASVDVDTIDESHHANDGGGNAGEAVSTGRKLLFPIVIACGGILAVVIFAGFFIFRK